MRQIPPPVLPYLGTMVLIPSAEEGINPQLIVGNVLPHPIFALQLHQHAVTLSLDGLGFSSAHPSGAVSHEQPDFTVL